MGALEEGRRVDGEKLEEMAQELKELQAENETLNDKLEELQLINAENKELREQLKKIEEDMKHDNLKRQLDKLYWVNRELIGQIRERDIQTDRLKDDFKELQHEDSLKDRQIEELDAKKRENKLNKELIAMTKRELEDTIKKQDILREENKDEIDKLKNEVVDLKKQLESRNREFNQQKQLFPDPKPQLDEAAKAKE